MINMRLKFIKGPETKYISHLDLMRTFQRALRRAHVPIHYTEGFNPHPSLSFASALGIGVTSIGEYLDIVLDEDMSEKDLMGKLNESLPQGLKIVDAVVLRDRAKSAMALVTDARYSIELIFKDLIDAEKMIADFMVQNSIVVPKEQPKKNFETTDVDIRPMIRVINVLHQENLNVTLDCIVACGSKANLKPHLLLEALRKFMGDIFEIKEIRRVELYANIDHELVPLSLVDRK
ncbi:TIGR03936 family radical SAM-associated protein [Lutispora thermophila]|uniref:Radical SAM-linked protein n=1 Tax=Lutispora thermophila DSM 19022 TaxID=1122184 RepID=A0A1M6FT37_9FIRM|nr:TIGR03936 family radical SAM-associated protein [Lutispora thermophila]SHJ00852.1 radical SAM-linked protein [Lutispora thermophila DSM 19022]